MLEQFFRNLRRVLAVSVADQVLDHRLQRIHFAGQAQQHGIARRRRFQEQLAIFGMACAVTGNTAAPADRA